MRPISRFLLVLCLYFFLEQASFAQEEKEYCANHVDMALVLAIDVSSSISDEEWALQQQAYARAFLDKNVAASFSSGRCRQVAITAFVWGSAKEQKVVVPWRVVGGEESAIAFSHELSKIKRTFFSAETNIGNAVMFAMALFKFLDFDLATERRVVDISGDGRDTSNYIQYEHSNEKPYPETVLVSEARKQAEGAGITINGLPIIIEEEELEEYYREQVITPDGFVETAEGMEDFARAICKKILLETIARAN